MHWAGYGRMFTHRFKTKTQALVAVLLLLACGDGGTGPTASPTTPTTPTPTPTPTPVATSITLSATSLSLFSSGATTQLTATVKDQNGATMASATVTWATSADTVATVSSAGLVTAVAAGTATVTATSGSASETAEITVNLTAPTLDAITVTWTEGAAATITGTRFSATASSNEVTVDGLTASITSASITGLQITVPTFVCKPSRVVDLVVTVASESATTTVGVKPAAVVSLELGAGVYAPGGECFHLDGGSGSEKYIMGFFSSSEAATSLTALRQTAIAGTTLAGEAAPDILIASEDVGYFEAPIIAFGYQPEATPALTQQVPIDPEQDAIWLRHREAELRRWEAWRQNRDEAVVREEIALRDMMGAQAADTIERSVGDTIAINHGNYCEVYDTLSTVVRHIGTSAFYVEDLDNPVATSFTASEYATLDATFSGITLPKLKEYYGEQYTGAFGLDNANRVAVVVTKEVNKIGSVLGYVSYADFWLPSGCARSNHGELFFGIAPDPDGVHGTALSSEVLVDYYPALLAHESTHILQITQSDLLGAASKAVWEIEGGATMAEWLVGNEVLNHGGTNKNLGLAQYIEGLDWYGDLMGDAAFYFGYSSSGKVAGAPERCTWVERDPPGVCGNSARAVYGVPAMLLRLILDWYGPGYSGGEAALMRDLTSSGETGYANLVTTTGADSFALIQTLFGLNLYSDGRTGVAQSATTSALTYFDYGGISLGLVEDAPLQPYTSSDAEPNKPFSVRGGSTASLEWEPPREIAVLGGHAPTSIRLATQSGGEPPDVIGMWIFRIQ